jgi:hypothetical protein
MCIGVSCKKNRSRRSHKRHVKYKVYSGKRRIYGHTIFSVFLARVLRINTRVYGGISDFKYCCIGAFLTSALVLKDGR